MCQRMKTNGVNIDSKRQDDSKQQTRKTTRSQRAAGFLLRQIDLQNDVRIKLASIIPMCN